MSDRPRRDAHWLATSAPELLTIPAAAEVLGIDARTVAEMIKREELSSKSTAKRTFVTRKCLLDILGLTREESC